MKANRRNHGKLVFAAPLPPPQVLARLSWRPWSFSPQEKSWSFTPVTPVLIESCPQQCR